MVQTLQDATSVEEGRLQGELEAARGEVEQLEMRCIRLGEEKAGVEERLREVEGELGAERRQAVGGNASLERKQEEIDNLARKIEHFKRELEKK